MQHVIDAKERSLGRVATEVAYLLRGKNVPSFQPHISGGNTVIVKNASGVRVTGNKFEDKIYYRHTGYTGHLKKHTYKEVFKNDPRKVIAHAVRGMLPKNALRRQLLKQLTIEA